MKKVVRLYGGLVTIEFDKESHMYRQIGAVEAQLPVPGFTSIASKIVPKHLEQWAANCAVDHIHTRWHGKMDGPQFESLCGDARKAHVTIRDAAGDIGTDVHRFCEEILKTRRSALPAHPSAQKACSAFLTWFEGTEIEVIESERICFSRHHWYCCTTDFYGFVNKERCVADFKTSSGVFYDETPILQLAANAIAIEEELEEPINVGWLLHLDKTTGKFYHYRVELNQVLKSKWREAMNWYRARNDLKSIIKQVKDNANSNDRGPVRQRAKTRKEARVG